MSLKTTLSYAVTSSGDEEQGSEESSSGDEQQSAGSSEDGDEAGPAASSEEDDVPADGSGITAQHVIK